MPWINGKFYMNPFYGRALERARALEEGQPWSEDDEIESEPLPNPSADQESEGEYELLSAQGHRQTHAAASRAHRFNHGAHRDGDYHDPATTVEGVANQVYNETAGLRPTDEVGNGPGSDLDLQQARFYIAHVIRNRAQDHIHKGLASDHLTMRDRAAMAHISPAYDAHGESLFESRRAASVPDPTGGATKFYLQSPNKRRPDWAKKPIATFGPFVNVAGGGDIPKGDLVHIVIVR